MPQAVDGTLRKFALRVPEVIYQCSGIMIFGKRIKSLVFSTDLSIIKNVNADAIIAVYPFTPQPIITQALLLAADIPVFAGVGGGLTQGQRVVNLAMFAEMQGATGVVLNAPTASSVVSHVAETIDIPVVLTVARADTDFDERIRAGAFLPFVGPIVDQAGQVHVAADVALTPQEIILMDYLAGNVIGRIPSVDELNDVAKGLVSLQGIRAATKE